MLESLGPSGGGELDRMRPQQERGTMVSQDWWPPAEKAARRHAVRVLRDQPEEADLVADHAIKKAREELLHREDLVFPNCAAFIGWVKKIAYREAIRRWRCLRRCVGAEMDLLGSVRDFANERRSETISACHLALDEIDRWVIYTYYSLQVRLTERITDRELAAEIFGKVRGGNLWFLRHRRAPAVARFEALLLEAGIDPETGEWL